MNDEENKSKALRDSIDRMADELAKVIKTAQSAYDKIAHVELREGSGAAWRMLSVAVCKLRHTLRPKPGTAAFLTEITDYYCANEPRLRLTTEPEEPKVYHTPKEVIDFVMANPPLGEVKDAPTPIDPSAPEMVYGGGYAAEDGRGSHEPSGGGAHPLPHGHFAQGRCQRCCRLADGRENAPEAALRQSTQQSEAPGAGSQRRDGGLVP